MAHPPHHIADGHDVTYGSYLMVDELLQLQHPKSRPEHPDELLFIIVHQSSELWFKVMLHELDMFIAHLQGNDELAALTTMRRVNALMRIVSSQLSALDTLPPQRFAEFRGFLGSASGGQSAQFRAIEAVSGLRDPHFIQVLKEHGDVPPIVQHALDRPTLQDIFLAMLNAKGTSLDVIYADPQKTPLFMLAESLIEYEQGFALWRFGHVQLVERIIGPMTGGTGGTMGAKYLNRTLQQRFFPKLWEVRSRFFGAGGGAPIRRLPDAMAVRDISVTLRPGTPEWPGDAPYDCRWTWRIADGSSVNLSAISGSPHVGTHADAPLHVRDGGAGAHRLPLEAFVGAVFVCDVRAVAASIEVADLQLPDGEGVERLLLRTGRSIADDRFPDGWPVPSRACLQHLIDRGLRLLGIDAPSVDQRENKTLENHHTIFDGGAFILENLDLRDVPAGRYELMALPLKVEGLDAAPVRAALRTLDEA